MPSGPDRMWRARTASRDDALLHPAPSRSLYLPEVDLLTGQVIRSLKPIAVRYQEGVHIQAGAHGRPEDGAGWRAWAEPPPRRPRFATTTCTRWSMTRPVSRREAVYSAFRDSLSDA